MVHTMSDTPRTDAQKKWIIDQLRADGFEILTDHPYYVLDQMGAKCKELEKELAAANERADKIVHVLTLVMVYPGLREYIGTQIFDAADAALDKAMEKGEYICKQCGLRKDAEHGIAGDF